MVETFISDLLCERASLQPNDTAFTFVDYEQDWAGVTKSLTWSQVYQRTVNVAQTLHDCGSTSDRVVIMAPQGLDYVVAFLGALHAGRIAVPLSLPLGGVSDERVSSVLRDASPTVVLTTSPAVETVAGYVNTQSGGSVPSIVEVDLLGLDARNASGAGCENHSDLAYLQYTSGSTRQPTGVMVSHGNLLANFGQVMSDFCGEYGGVAPPDTTIVSWLPFYHDMGLILGICAPVLGGIRAVLTSPVSFLQRPARWMQLLAKETHAFSAAPNFAFELAARKTADEDMAGLDLADVLVILSGSERVHPATLRRFTERFARLNLPDKAVRPAYGLAEATVYALTRTPAQPPKIVHFQTEKLTAGTAERIESLTGTQLVSYGAPRSPMIRIVDPDSRIECPQGTVGEIWIHGDNVAMGYWEKPRETERTFGDRLVTPPAGTPEAPWLRTGDSGFFSEGELFIIGRIKDLLIVYGRNHSPDDIEATVQEITRGRCAAVAVPHGGMEKLVVIIEVKNQGAPHQEGEDKLVSVEREVTSAVSNSHGVGVSDLVVVAPGSIPITTSGKVRRAECVEQYRQGQFARLNA